MRHIVRVAFIALILTLVSGPPIFNLGPPAANATVTPPLVVVAGYSSSLVSNQFTLIDVDLDLAGNTTEQTRIQVSALGGDAAGTLALVSCVPGLCTDSNVLSTIVDVDEDAQDSIRVAVTVTCSTGGVVRVTATGQVTLTTAFIDITCSPVGTVIISASPNLLLPCGGGTTTLTAKVVDAFGNTIPGYSFDFSTTAGLLVETSATTANLTLAPNSTGATVTAKTGSASSSVAVLVDCSGQVTAKASPNLLPCDGGTTTITADVFDILGNSIDDAFFHFSTTAGILDQTSDNTANLTLGPGQIAAVVTVSIFDPGNATPKTATVNVALECNNFVSLVVTAEPNVVPCLGMSEISATVRDANGHVVKGVGFHFATDTGLLVVSPNTASTEKGKATLTLAPGMPSSTVKVSVGTLQGTIEGTVTVQQFCPVTAPDRIQLKLSDSTLDCGQSAFVGVTVKDESNQIPVDGTIVSFIATSGTVLPSDEGTINGTLHVVYTPGVATNGNVTISAASGASFGSASVKVECNSAQAAAAAAAGRITPPSTGDGGLR